MRNLRAWAIILGMCIAVFALSGCGGGSLDGSSSESGGDNTPKDVTDTYNTAEVLNGSWSAVNSTYNFNTEVFTFRLNSARLTFSDLYIPGSVGEANITSRQEWHSSYYDEEMDQIIDLGIQSLRLNFDSLTGTMIHQDRDKWRCNVDAGGNNKILMNIAISSDKIIQVNYQGTAESLYDNTSAEYNFTLDFRKEEYTD